MTNEELLSVAEIVEKLTDRFNAQAALHRERFDEHVKLIASMKADHEAKMVEHRAAFGARTEADAKIIAGLRSTIGAARMAVLERDSLISERAKLQSIINEQSASAKEAGEKLGWTGNESPIQAVERVVRERDGLLTQVQDMRAEVDSLKREERATHDTLKPLVERITSERDALRAEVAALQERLRASIARGDFAQMEVAALKSQTPKHPVKVGEWVRRTKKCAHFGHVAKVLAFIEPCSYEVQCIEGRGIWYFHNCEPCDTPEATHAEPDLTQLHAKGKEAWSDVPNATQWVEEMRGNSEATHDTEAGKAAAESAVKTEPVTEEIKVGDLGEVFQATTRTLNSDVGITGCVSSIHLDPCHGGFLVKFDPSTQSRRSAGMQAFGLCDVRKVTT